MSLQMTWVFMCNAWMTYAIGDFTMTLMFKWNALMTYSIYDLIYDVGTGGYIYILRNNKPHMNIVMI